MRGRRLRRGGVRAVAVGVEEVLEANHFSVRIGLQPAAKHGLGEPSPWSFELEHLSMGDHGSVLGLLAIEGALEIKEPPGRASHR